MSLTAVNTLTPQNVNHLPHQSAKPPVKHHVKPSVENSESQLTPTDAAKAVQNTGDQHEVQNEQGKADLSNPLTAAATQFNSRVAAGGI